MRLAASAPRAPSALYARGANVALVGLEPERLRENAERLGERAAWFEADVTDMAALQDAVAATVERFGGIDVAIANAGIAFTGTLSTAPVEQVERTLAVNLLGVWRTDRAVLEELRRSRGYLLNIASLAAVTHSPMMGPYTSAKAGVEALSDALRTRARSAWGGRRVRLLRVPRHRPRQSQLRHALHRSDAAADARLDAQAGPARRRRSTRSSAASAAARRGCGRRGGSAR